MDKNEKVLSCKLSVVLFVVSWVILTGCYFLSKLTAPYFDSINYGQNTKFFVGIVLCVSWAATLVIMVLVVYAKFGINLLTNPDTIGRELETKNLLIVIGLVMVSIFVISAQIGFEVKPFYDLGVKFTGYELMAKIAVILCNVIKCAWVVIMMEMVEDFMSHFNKKEIVPYGGIVLMLTAGLFDVAFSLVTLPVTYVLLYLVYGLIFRITHESVSKTFLCVVLIYIL